MTENEAMAHVLQVAIISAICEDSKEAKKWLLLDRKLSWELATLEPGGFIECCQTLGLNWRELRRTLKGAIAIPDVVPTSVPMLESES